MATTLIETIRLALIAGVASVAGRVYEMEGAPKPGEGSPAYPFLIVGEAVLDAGEAWGGLGQPMDVYVYHNATFEDVNLVAAEVVTALHQTWHDVGAPGSLTAYLSAHVSTGPDTPDPDWRFSVTRRLTFLTLAMRVISQRTFAPDPITALETWAAAAWPGTLQTNPLTWAPSTGIPLLYWRWEQELPPARTNWGVWYEWAIRGHVIAATEDARQEWARRISERAAVVDQVALSDGSELQVRSQGADMRADPVRLGQLRLVVTWGVLDGAPAGAIIQNARIRRGTAPTAAPIEPNVTIPLEYPPYNG